MHFKFVLLAVLLVHLAASVGVIVWLLLTLPQRPAGLTRQRYLWQRFIINPDNRGVLSAHCMCLLAAGLVHLYYVTLLRCVLSLFV